MRRQPAIPAIVLAVFALGAVALTIARHPAPLALARQPAIRAALRDPAVCGLLAGSGWDHATATALDGRADRVTFLAGGQVVAEAQVSATATVSHAVDFRALTVPYGNWIAFEPGLLAGLAALFVLMTAVVPWRRLDNLDVVAVLSLVAAAVVLRARYVEASVIAALPGLVYLMLRCAAAGLGSGSQPLPSTPLWRTVTAALPMATRLRILRVIAAALSVAFVMVAVSSTTPVDVIYGVMEGATKLVHGVLPYGHMPGDVVHGDTYPILSYALYAPLAALSPVSSLWSSVDLALGAGAVCALAVTVALGCARWQGDERRIAGGRGPERSRRRGVEPRSPAAREAGLRAALSWLSFPLVLVTVSTGTTDTVLAAIVVMAILTWRRPAVATGLLTAGAWVKLAPAALLPLALAPLRRRGLARALLAIAAVSLPSVALLVAMGGRHGVGGMIHAVAFQFSRSSEQSPWSALGVSWLQPCGEAAVLALIAGAAAKVARDRDLARDRRRIAAVCAAILIGLQLTAEYWAFLYVIWVVPLMCVSVLGQDRAACEPHAETTQTLKLRAQPAPA